MDDAARGAAGKNTGQRGMSCDVARQYNAMHGTGSSVGAKHISRADLHASGAEPQRCGNAVCIDDVACGDNWNIHRIHDLRQQCERTDLRIEILREEHAAMPAGLETLRDDRICPVRLQPDGFFCRGGR